MHNNKFGFIITKPLQLMVVMAILKQLAPDSEKEFLLVDAFAGAEGVAAALDRQHGFVGCVNFFETHDLAYAYAVTAGYDKLFIDSDVGVRKFFTLLKFKLKNRKARIAVYEEGLGTYRNDLYPGWMRFLRLLGVGTYFGDCFFTDEIFLFRRDEYLSNIPSASVFILPIEVEINAFLIENISLMNDVFSVSKELISLGRDLNAEFCLVYLSDWVLRKELIGRFSMADAFRVLKRHPHDRSSKIEQVSGFFEVDSFVPAELLLANLSVNFKRVFVFHHGSSVTRYFVRQNVDFDSIS